MERDWTCIVCTPSETDMSRDDDIVFTPALKSTVIWYPLLGGAGGGVQETVILSISV